MSDDIQTVQTDYAEAMEMLYRQQQTIKKLRAENARLKEALAAEKALTNACERVNKRNDELAEEILRLRAENERLLESTEYYKNKDAKNGQDISNLVSKTEKLREALKQIHDAVDFPEDTLRRKIRAARAAIGDTE